MDKISGVYSIKNPKGSIYVGSSKNIKKRFYQYKGLYETKQVKLYNSFKKYGVENHEFKIIEICDTEKLYERERHWGDLLNVLDRDKGLNLMLPGSKDKKLAMSKETKDKIGKAHKGKKLSEEHKRILTTCWIEKKQKKEHINKRKMFGKDNPAYGSTWNKGRKRTPEQVKQMSERMKGKYLLGENNNSKNVVDKKTGRIYASAKEISNEYDLNYSTLKAWLQGLNQGSKHELRGRFEYVE